VNVLRSAPQPVDSAQAIGRQCVFCLEGIRLGASVCPHCGSNLAPLQDLADKDAALEERLTTLERTAQDIVASAAAISLSHYAGSALAEVRLRRAEQAATETTAARQAASPIGGSTTGSRMHIEPARIKSTADTIKALYDAAAPLAAGAAALWAAFGHTLF
jgi:hypothetical protein